MKKIIISSVCFASAMLLSNSVLAAPIVFPNNGQSQAQQQKDEGECHMWAVNKTGFDPSYATTPQAKPQAAQGGAIRGAAKGALLGTAVGAISGDTGKGAAIGATVGGASGINRRRNQYRNMAAEQQALQAEQASRANEYQRAREACLSAKGYTVR